MKLFFQTREPAGPGWLQDVPRPRSRSRARATARFALVCVLLVGGATLLSHPRQVAGKVLTLWRGAPPVDRSVPLADLIKRVEAAENAGQHAEVARLCGAIMQLDPAHPVVEPAHVRRIQALIAMNDAANIVREMQDFRRRHPDSELLPEVLLDVASWQYETHAYIPAAQTYTDLVALVTNPKVTVDGEDTAPPSPVIIRSLTLWKAHMRAERSRSELERLARFNQALCYENAADREAALRSYDRFVARFPQDEHCAEARFRVANLHLQQGNTVAALESFRAVYEDTSAAVAWRCESVYRAGKCELSLRRPDAALATYRRAVPLRPLTNEFRLAALAELAPMVNDQEPALALQIYRELAEHSPEPAVRAVALQRSNALQSQASILAVPH